MPQLSPNLQKLFAVAQKEERMAIGLMSGTSLDGLDIALCRFSGAGLQTQVQLLQFTTMPYTDDFRQQVKQVFANRQADLELVCLLNAQIGSLHAEMILQALQSWSVSPAEVDFVASHGQTIYHAPRRLHGRPNYPNATLQIGDGDHIAVKTGILTLSDFRQKHVAAGGEGAPLALYGDVILGSQPGEDRILLNIGGIANLTYLPAGGDTSQVICTDVGPGNTLIDAACRRYFNLPYDDDGRIAAQGEVHTALLAALLNHPFFTEASPKTTGPELFSLAYLDRALAQVQGELSPHDIISTLSCFTVRAVAGFVKQYITAPQLKVLVSGGGARNGYMLTQLKAELPQATVENSAAININPDAKEAMLFALLGNEALTGQPLVIGSNPAVLMGKISFPY